MLVKSTHGVKESVKSGKEIWIKFWQDKVSLSFLRGKKSHFLKVVKLYFKFKTMKPLFLQPFSLWKKMTKYFADHKKYFRRKSVLKII